MFAGNAEFEAWATDAIADFSAVNFTAINPMGIDTASGFDECRRGLPLLRSYSEGRGSVDFSGFIFPGELGSISARSIAKHASGTPGS